MRKGFFIAAVSAAVLLAAGAVCFFLWQEGLLIPNRPSKEQFPVQGVDVSAHQGKSTGRFLLGRTFPSPS